jgi:acyl-homoserine lactone acylase PvdQ
MKEGFHGLPKQKELGKGDFSKIPNGAPGVETRLPSWGTGGYEWQGILPFSLQPHFISRRSDPAARDYTYNWNNKPAVGWDNGDDTNWGEIHRVDALRSQMDALLDDEGTMTRLDVINVMNSAATVDPRVAKLLPQLDRLVEDDDDPVLRHALAALRAWAAEGPAPGAHRVDRDGDGLDEHGPAIRIWDAWNERLVEDIFLDEVGSLRALIGVGIVDAPGAGGSAFFDGMFNHVLHVLARHPSLRPRHDWLGDESRESVATRALREALASLGATTTSTIDSLTMPVEEIVFTSFGAHPEIRIPWVNRGTWTHIAELTGRR